MSWNIGKDVAEGVVGGILGPIKDLISEFVEDKDKRNQIAAEIAVLAATHAHDEIVAQIKVNEKEAESGSLFVSGWRPAAGWCCVLGMAMNFLIIPIFGPLIITLYPEVKMIPLDLSVMLPVLLGMLGLTAARSVEKINNVASK